MLERQLGAPLFERDRQGVSLTQVGTALLPHARRMLAEWGHTAAQVLNYAKVGASMARTLAAFMAAVLMP